MKKIASLLMSLALASSVIAGPVTISSKGSKMVAPIAPEGCTAFAPGGAFGAFAGGFIPSGGDAKLGGGVLGEYFFTENLGVQGSYGVYATNSEHHQFDGSLVLRAPIKSICVAPYLLAGGGVSTNSTTRGDYHVGAGIDARFSSLHNIGIFADGAYHFASEGADFTIVRLGVKFPF